MPSYAVTRASEPHRLHRLRTHRQAYVEPRVRATTVAESGNNNRLPMKAPSLLFLTLLFLHLYYMIFIYL